MKIVTYRENDQWRAGALVDEFIYDIASALSARGREPLREPSVLSLLENYGASMHQVAEAIDFARQEMKPTCRLQKAVLAPPVPEPKKILCIGLNYKGHVEETGRKLPEYPDVFVKFPGSLIGPNDRVEGLQHTSQLDFEGELAVVIGRKAKNVPAAEALSYVAGAMVLNDITARDLQYRGTQWLMGKSVDGTTPSGPSLVTMDEIDDIQNLDITTHLNGVQMQASNTRHMIFPVARIIEYISATIALEPGDIIATGTPDGIGAKRNPPIYLRPDDEITVSVEKVGALNSKISQESLV